MRAIQQWIRDPEVYYQMCQRARDRFERELNWDVATKQVAETMRQAVENA